MNNKVRIIAGQWRSRQIHFTDSPGLRPTPARVRETLFNWLQDDIINSRCLDLYAGSGALGFEAVSRGANCVWQVEENPQVCRQLHENSVNLGAQAQVKIVQNQVLRFLGQTDAEPFNLVFIDPPFAKNLAVPTCQWLEDKGWLAPQAKIYLEVEFTLALAGMPQNWQRLKHKTAGEVGYYLFQRG
jgi:16S rRNA (guanine966-N2)-methyltransferase